MQWFIAIVSTSWCYLGNKRLSVHAFFQTGIHERRHAEWILSLLDLAVLPPSSWYQLIPSLTIDENSEAVQRLHHPSCNIHRDEGEYLASLSSPPWDNPVLSQKNAERLFPAFSLMLLIYLVSQGTALCWGWTLLGAATPNAADELLPLASAGHQWTCGPSGAAKCLTFGKLIGWVYKYSYNRKDNSLVSVE